MRIGVDNVSTGEATMRGAPGGLRMYLQEQLGHLTAAHPQNEFVLFTPEWADPLLEHPPPNLQMVKLPGVPRHRAARTLYQQTVLARAIERERLDVFFATATVAPLSGQTPIVLAVQFLQFYTHPQTYGRMRTMYLKALLPRSCRRSYKVIAFTENAKRDLASWTGTPPAKITVIPHGLGRAVWELADLPLDADERKVGMELTGGRPYVVYISATYGYKNHARLIQAFARAKRRRGLPQVLLLVGSEVNVTFAELKELAKAEGIGEHVIFAGQQSPHRRALATLLGANAAVIPTLYETFGFPALEAMALGCPVVTSNIGSMAELAGDAAHLVDPYDVEAIAEGIEEVLCDEQLRRRLSAAGRARAANYTWAQSAARTVALLEEAAREGRASGG